jgi:hypothetical protein
MRDHKRDVEVHEQFFEGAIWDDPEDAEPEPAAVAPDGAHDDVEGHASGFG